MIFKIQRAEISFVLLWRLLIKKVGEKKFDFLKKRTTVETNLNLWDEDYAWPEDGDEWSGQARFCNQSYSEWKNSIVDAFIAPYISKDTSVLEIAPGHGRWTKEIVGRCGKLTIIDLSPSCIDFCKGHFASYDNISYLVNDGKSLEGVRDDSVDFIWSFDSFVHMSSNVIDSYFSEIKRVLKDNGKAVVHHAGRNDFFIKFNFLRDMGGTGRRLYKLLSVGKFREDDGWRSDVSREIVMELAVRNGLNVEYQVQSWGDNNKYSVEKYRDIITCLSNRL